MKLPFSTEEPVEAQPEPVPADTANNMALLYARKVRDGLCTIEDVPQALRAAVQQLLGGE